jgi:hypothetical protein
MQDRNFKSLRSSASFRLAMFRFAILATLTAILLLGANAPAQQVTQNGFTSFDPPLSLGTYPSAINRNGQIGGMFGDGKFAHGFLRQADGTFITINPPTSLDSWVTAINDAGDAVGYFDSFSAPESLPGFVRYAAGIYRTFSVPHAYTTFPRGINDSGVVAGFATFRVPGSVGFLWDVNHGVTLIQVPGSAPDTTVVTAINNAGAVTGYYQDNNSHTHGFIRSSNGHFTTFAIEDNPSTKPLAITSSGTIAGWVDTGERYSYGFIRKLGGSYALLGTGDDSTSANAINDNGVVVGNGASEGDGVAFIFDGTGSVKLITLPFDHTFSTAYGINAAGQVTGSYTDSAGVIHGWVGTL